MIACVLRWPLFFCASWTRSSRASHAQGDLGLQLGQSNSRGSSIGRVAQPCVFCKGGDTRTGGPHIAFCAMCGERECVGHVQSRVFDSSNPTHSQSARISGPPAFTARQRDDRGKRRAFRPFDDVVFLRRIILVINSSRAASPLYRTAKPRQRHEPQMRCPA
jgi:hypothetical protein